MATADGCSSGGGGGGGDGGAVGASGGVNGGGGGGGTASSSSSIGRTTELVQPHQQQPTSCQSPLNSSSSGGSCSPADRPATPLVNGHSGDSMAGSAAANSPAKPSPTSSSHSNCSAAAASASNSNGPRYKLLHEGDIQLCRLNHTRTIVSKIMNSKYLRRWESHHLKLGDCEIRSSTAPLYAPGAEFKCLDGSATIPFSRINDDYCDCDDASDEPGTSACPNGSFHCTNPGYRPKNIPSSWVNDGVCDCCDGTDEYEGGHCQNDCKELGKAMREEADRLSELLKEGHVIHQEYVQKGQQARKEKQERQVELEKERDALELKRGDLEVIKEEAEKPETEGKDRHKAAWEAEKERRKGELENVKGANAFKHLDINQDSVLTTEEMQLHIEFDIDTNGEVSYEEAKEYLEDNQQVDESLFVEKVWPNIKEIYQEKKDAVAAGDEAPEQVPQTEDSGTQEEIEYPEVTEGYTDDEDQEEEDPEDDDDEDPEDVEDREDEEDPIPDPHLLGDDDFSNSEVTTEPKGDEMPEYDEATKLLIEAADQARNEFNEVDRQFKDMESEITEIKKFLEIDMGPSLEYYPLKGQCYDYTDREYTYSLCPFERASQRGKHGGSETSLGSWGKWVSEGDNLYSAMKYEKGQNCWNGPDRSAKVLISCGKTTELLAVSEPNRCEYEFKFTTPAACSKPPKATEFPHEEL